MIKKHRLKLRFSREYSGAVKFWEYWETLWVNVEEEEEENKIIKGFSFSFWEWEINSQGREGLI